MALRVPVDPRSRKICSSTSASACGGRKARSRGCGSWKRTLGLAGVGLICTIEPLVADEVARGRLRVVLEPYLPTVPGLFLYFPSRSQISPAFRALVDFARDAMAQKGTLAKSPNRA